MKNSRGNTFYIVSTAIAAAMITVSASVAHAACAANVRDFGAIANDATSDSAQIQNAITAAQNAGGGDVCFQAGRYRLSSVIQWTVSTAQKPVTLAGVAGATILSPDNASNGAIWINGIGYAAGSNIGHFNIRNIIVSPYTGVTPTGDVAGINIGRSGQFIDGALKSQLSNVLVEKYPVGIRIRNTRQIQLDRVVVRDPVTFGVDIVPTDEVAGAFVTGDIVFNNLEVFVPTTSNSFGVRIGNTGTKSIRRIRIANSTIYGGSPGIQVNANGARVDELTLESTAMYAPKTKGLTVWANGTGRVTGLLLSNISVVAGTYVHSAVVLAGENGGSVESAQVVGGFIGDIGGGIDVWGKVVGLSVANVSFFALPGPTVIPASAAIALNGHPNHGYPKSISVMGNTHLPKETDPTSKLDHLVVVYPGVCSVVVMGNTASLRNVAVSDRTGTACPAGNKVLGPNVVTP